MRIFLSYSRRDTEFVDRLYDSLTVLGYSVWTDRRRIPGLTDDQWRVAVVEAIEASAVFVIVISPDSTAVEECRARVDGGGREVQAPRPGHRAHQHGARRVRVWGRDRVRRRVRVRVGGRGVCRLHHVVVRQRRATPLDTSRTDRRRFDGTTSANSSLLRSPRPPAATALTSRVRPTRPVRTMNRARSAVGDDDGIRSADGRTHRRRSGRSSSHHRARDRTVALVGVGPGRSRESRGHFVCVDAGRG